MQFLGKDVDTPVVFNDRGHGPDSAVLDHVNDVPVAMQRHVPMVFEVVFSVQFLDKVIDMPVISQSCAHGDPDSAVLAVQWGARGDSTGAVFVLGVVFTPLLDQCLCPLLCRHPWRFHRCSSQTRILTCRCYADTRGDSTGARCCARQVPRSSLTDFSSFSWFFDVMQ